MNKETEEKEKIKKYFEILEPNFPEWLNEYIETKEMQSQQYISVTCGTIYSNLFESEFFFSSLDHSIAVALIVWHFTHDKKQTLAGLFHDIYRLLDLEDIKEIYNDIEIQKNEENEKELGFKTKKLLEIL